LTRLVSIYENRTDIKAIMIDTIEVVANFFISPDSPTSIIGCSDIAKAVDANVDSGQLKT